MENKNNFSLEKIIFICKIKILFNNYYYFKYAFIRFFIYLFFFIYLQCVPPFVSASP